MAFYNLVGTPTGKKAIAIASQVSAGCTVCSMEVSMETDGGAFNKLFFYTWYQDKKNTVEVLMKQENNRFVLKQISNGLTIAKAKGITTINPGQFYDVKVTFDGANFTLIVDGNTLATMPAAVTPNGTTGMAVKNTTAHFDYTIVN